MEARRGTGKGTEWAWGLRCTIIALRQMNSLGLWVYMGERQAVTGYDEDSLRFSLLSISTNLCRHQWIAQPLSCLIVCYLGAKIEQISKKLQAEWWHLKASQTKQWCQNRAQVIKGVIHIKTIILYSVFFRYVQKAWFTQHMLFEKPPIELTKRLHQSTVCMK